MIYIIAKHTIIFVTEYSEYVINTLEINNKKINNLIDSNNIQIAILQNMR